MPHGFLNALPVGPGGRDRGVGSVNVKDCPDQPEACEKEGENRKNVFHGLRFQLACCQPEGKHNRKWRACSDLSSGSPGANSDQAGAGSASDPSGGAE